MIKRRTLKPQLRTEVSFKNALELVDQSKKLLQEEENFGDQDEIRLDQKRKWKYVTKKVYNISGYDSFRLKCCLTLNVSSIYSYQIQRCYQYRGYCCYKRKWIWKCYRSLVCFSLRRNSFSISHKISKWTRLKGNLYMVLLLREILFEKRLFTLKCSKSQGMKLKTYTEFLKLWLKWQWNGLTFVKTTQRKKKNNK